MGPMEDLHLFPIPDTFAHISNDILTFWISWNTFTHISNEILTFLKNLYPGHICTYFKWNINILDQLEHIYTYFTWNVNILKNQKNIPCTFAHISNEILTCWISWNTFTHISNDILTFSKDLHTTHTHLYIFQIKYLHFGSVGTHLHIFQMKY